MRDALAAAAAGLALTAALACAAEQNPYAAQVIELVTELSSGAPGARARAAEKLGFLRAYAAEANLIAALEDDSSQVRRQAAISLAWCGGRRAVAPLLAALDDDDWLVRQGAHVALTNLTGLELPYDTTAAADRRARQAKAWRDWWASVPADRPPKEALALLSGAAPPSGGTVTASTTYKGPPEVLRDGQIGPAFWQTKNVPFPQWCTVDLGEVKAISRVVVHQYGPRFVMTQCALSVSVDNRRFEQVERRKGATPVRLEFTFRQRKARYVRITSFASRNRTYPTTFFEIEVGKRRTSPRSGRARAAPRQWRLERGLRALGALGGSGATEAVLRVLGKRPTAAMRYRPMVRAGLRALGRLRDPAGCDYLVALLDETMWARYAADALGDFGDARAVGPLLAAYPKYAKDLRGRNPKRLPRDDRMGFPSEDRMLETPYYIAYALCRLGVETAADRAALRKIAPIVMANLPGDYDTFMLYQQEVGHRLTRYLLERAGLRQQACEHAFEVLGQKRRVAEADDGVAWSPFRAARISAWLPCVCTEAEDLPRLLALLRHKDGWVRINAAKTIAFRGDRRAVEPLARILNAAKCEADFGYDGTFKHEEYKDPAPRWREAIVRALGRLHAERHTEMIVRILEDERSVVEVRYAAAQALADIATPQALAALRRAAAGHSFFCVRHVARDALRARGLRLNAGAIAPPRSPAPPPAASPARPADAIVFIKGSNNIPNTVGTVEQADRWRQTYVVTDSGPAYRPGRNLYLLRPANPAGEVTPLTHFREGYVGEPELSWDASHVLFCRRGGKDDPWWQIYRVDLDGRNLRRLTAGPYHHVGPCYLPDGRIVFSSSRSGIRDEYHGYPCTVLCVMNADGSGIEPIATNIGRDNEPAVLRDGRVVFSRLEVFYSRNKTELTLHAAHADGTQDVVLYGPERRQFWRRLNHGPRTPADGQEAPLTHRVLRMTQPQAMPDGRHVVVATQGGLTLVDARRDAERIVTADNTQWSYTTPWPLADGRILCAATLKTPDRKKVDLGLYVVDPATGEKELVYNDPLTADFEPRAATARRPPPMPPGKTVRGAYGGRFVCSSAFYTQEKDVALRGRLVRLIEGVPIVGRHSTQTNRNPVWRNHGGTFARVLGTAPLAPDGSFYVQAPADRLLHFQVLDSDRRVLANQLTWIYPRPGEVKSCVGCHENPQTSSRGRRPAAASRPPVCFLPDGREFTYRAKAWFKGSLPEIIDERTRTVRSVNLLGR